MSETSSYVTKLERGYCKAAFLDDSIFLTVLSGQNGFTGELDSAKLTEIQTSCSGKFKESVADMAKQAFSTNSGHYSLGVEDDLLIWRKVGGSKMKLRIAAIPLQSISYEDAKTEIMDFLLKSNREQASDLKDCRTKLQKKSSDMDSALKQIRTLTEDQVKSREALMADFIPILNTKKRHILDLEEQLRDQRSRVDDEDSDSSGYDGNTDDEDDTCSELRGEKRKHSPKSSDAENSQSGDRKSAKMDHNDSFEAGLFEDD